MENIQEENAVEKQVITNHLVIGESSKTFLNEIGGRAKFLGILGFIFVGIIVLVAIFAGSVLSEVEGMSNMPGGGIFITILYLIMAAFYFFPIYYLFLFAKNIKEALNAEDNISLDEAFKNLKSHYKFMGITAAVILSIYLVFGLIAGAAYLFMA